MKKLIGFFADGLPFDGDTIKYRALGGSETALYYMARELHSLGNEVKVICDCENPGTYDGVEYFHNKDFKYLALTTNFDIFIVSRSHDFFQVPFRSKVNILWNHDILTDKFSLVKYLSKIDYLFHLSDFHVKNYTTKIPKSKSMIWQTRNGIDIEAVNGSVKATKKNPDKMIYASRPERGLQILLESIWPGLLKEFPNLELYICGYTIGDMDVPEHIKDLYVHIDRLIKQTPGVFDLGNLSKLEYYSHLAESQLMLYPCNFPEISCIVALEAQACRTPVVTTNDFALKETVGVKEWLIDGMPEEKEYQESFIDKVSELITKPSLYEKTVRKGYNWVRSRYTYRAIAEEWDAFFEDCLQDIGQGQASTLRKTDHIFSEFRRGSPCGYPISGKDKPARIALQGIAGRPRPYGKMKIFRNNLKLLSKHNPHLARQLEDVIPTNDIQVVVAKSGLPVLKHHVALHSLIDPEREARKWANRSDISAVIKDRKKIAVFGFGAGYHIKALLELDCPSIVVIEPEPAILSVAFEWIDFSAYLGKITLVLGTDEISDFGNLCLIPHQPTMRLHKDVYLLWKERIKSAQQPRETVADLLAAYEGHEDIVAFLRNFDPDEVADIDKLVEKIPRGEGPLKDWQTILFLMKELKNI